jgi:hypothetical protein
LPDLPQNLVNLIYSNNPIADILDSLVQNTIKHNLKVLNKFKYLYYCLKFKIKFIQWFLRSNKTKIMEKNHPNKIIALLANGVDIDDLDKYL